MRTIGMGSAPKAEDARAESAVKKENAALKKSNAELAKQVEALTARMADCEGADITSPPNE